jgi:DNA mismatch repair protein MutS
VSLHADKPMFRQYLELKSQVPDALLFFRMGDFYELFFEDAQIAAGLLDLTLTARMKESPEPVPMAGVPHHAAKSYIVSLVEQGHKVAIAEQVEDPKLAKGIVKRAITRVVTPGLAFDAEDLAPREACWLAGLVQVGETWGLALLDASTGDLRVADLEDRAAALEELARAEIREAVLPEGLDADAELLGALANVAFTAVDPGWFDVEAARRDLCERLQVADLTGFGCEELGPSLGAAAALVAYAERATHSRLSHLRGIRSHQLTGFMVLDQATRRNLEILRPLNGRGRKGSLLDLMDRTCTSGGGRLLREWLTWPLLDREAIAHRLDRVEALVEGTTLRDEVRGALVAVADIERIAGKLAAGTASPRGIAALRRSLDAVPGVFEKIARCPELCLLVPDDLCGEVAVDIATWLVEEPPIQLTEGGLIVPGIDAELDELVALARGGRGTLAQLESRERAATGITSLKVRYNKVFGYFIEVTRANLHKVPESYLRKQTLTNAERYITPELKELEEKVLGADERRKALEHERFLQLRERLAVAVPRLQAVGDAIAALDVYAGLAELAVDRRYVRPTVDGSRDLVIKGGRHPVVESQELGESFVPNDLTLRPKDRRLVILTGPNMSGKSTVMRQVALIALMAQLGSYVPADSARIGICDRIFTRVGASDDLASGRSTFMVEMSETANILHHATDRSLVILDEIGRGTSTYDGLSIAWAVAEDLHDRLKARTLFATHYHELLELADVRPGVHNLSVAVSEWGERILFLRRLKEGGASRSYGIQCARLAGMPLPVVERAKKLLVRLEKHAGDTPTPQLGLFGEPAEAAAEPLPDPLRVALAEIDPDALSPRDALAVLYRLKGVADEEESG